jgi:hypothetical protein
MSTALLTLPEITLRAPAATPPIRLLLEFEMRTPRGLGVGEPVVSNPTSLPEIVSPPPWSSTWLSEKLKMSGPSIGLPAPVAPTRMPSALGPALAPLKRDLDDRVIGVGERVFGRALLGVAVDRHRPDQRRQRAVTRVPNHDRLARVVG